MTRHKTRYPGVYFRIAAYGERRYQISYTDSSGKRIFKTVNGTEKDAVRQRNQLLERMAKGERVVSSKLTLKTLAEDYLRTQTSHLKASSLARYGYDLDKYILPRLGDRQVSTIGVDDIADFIAEMRQTHAAWTIRGCLTPLSRMFQYAVRRGWASANPVTALDRQERPKGSGKQMRILSSDEIQQVLAAVKIGAPVFQRGRPTTAEMSAPSLYPLFMTAIFAGLRIGELLQLQWEDVDLAAGEIHVRASKTDAGIRTVVIPEFLVQALASYGNSTTGFVFVSKAGQPMKYRRVSHAFRTALVRAGVEHCRFHDLRHTYASLLIGQGEDVTFVADQMGHSSPNVTLTIYAKLFDPVSRRKQARERMQESFKEVGT